MRSPRPRLDDECHESYLRKRRVNDSTGVQPALSYPHGPSLTAPCDRGGHSFPEARTFVPINQTVRQPGPSRQAAVLTRDTTREAESVQVEAWRRMSPLRKLGPALVRRLYPDAAHLPDL